MSPLFPRRSPPHKVHWNWEILLPCNYRCSYCRVHDEKKTYLRRSVEL